MININTCKKFGLYTMDMLQTGRIIDYHNVRWWLNMFFWNYTRSSSIAEIAQYQSTFLVRTRVFTGVWNLHDSVQWMVHTVYMFTYFIDGHYVGGSLFVVCIRVSILPFYCSCSEISSQSKFNLDIIITF